ncbi:DUF4190 domain-containing protein [Nocardia cyriacigeorgica]|uniref:DUF4190 domain-containing protein n=1 Tax=Nocardia cyriacigeorgica TaxID=135487 RepID=UPI0013B63103|nr:DUF4190 domain-containing protein [Nocardia cyriacigeorgica]NEW52604.1 DUF4190 domain-containing protein [Nocardia cyriacigeorgica]
MTNPGDSDEWWKQYGGQGVSSESGGAGSVPQHPAAEQPGYPSGQQYPAAPQYPSQPGAPAQPQYPAGSQPQYPAYQQPAADPYAQQAYPQQGYPQQQGYGYPYQAGYQPYGMPPVGTNGMAIGSLITSCIGLLCCGLLIVPLVGLILGLVALNQIKQSRQEGRGLAIAGISVGAVGLTIGILYWILYIVGVVSGFGT